jgi:hypothetical protein
MTLNSYDAKYRKIAERMARGIFEKKSRDGTPRVEIHVREEELAMYFEAVLLVILEETKTDPTLAKVIKP